MRRWAALIVLALAAAPSTAVAAPAAKVRVGGPGAPVESKVAIVGTNRALAGDRFVVRDSGGHIVLRGHLRRARGRPDPWRHAYAVDLTQVTEPADYAADSMLLLAALDAHCAQDSPVAA